MIIKDESDAYLGRDLEAMSAADNYHRSILKTFGPFTGERVLEVGAGSGNLSELILERGVEKLYAVEPSENMYPLLEKCLAPREEAVAMHGFLGSVQEELEGPLDTAIYVNVMEHVEHDVDEMKLVKEHLRPGGHLCIYVPAMSMLYSSFDESLGHFRRYSKRELREKLETAGYEVLDVRYSDFPGFFAWWLYCKVGGKEITPGGVGLYDKVVVPVNDFVERFVPLPFGKNLIAIAKAP